MEEVGQPKPLIDIHLVTNCISEESILESTHKQKQKLSQIQKKLTSNGQPKKRRPLLAPPHDTGRAGTRP